MQKPLESDWKTFRRRAPEWRERYLQAKNREVLELLTDERSTPTERFWAAKERMDRLAAILVECLDNHTRSNMHRFLAAMYHHGLIGDADLDEFSAELREETLFLGGRG